MKDELLPVAQEDRKLIEQLRNYGSVMSMKAADHLSALSAKNDGLRKRVEELERVVNSYMSGCSNDECELCESARQTLGERL